MGSDNSKSAESESAEGRKEEKVKREREAMKILEQLEYAEWRKAQLIEKHHREMRAQEDAKLKQANEERQRQESLRQQQLQQQHREQQVQAQILYQQQLQQQQLQQFQQQQQLQQQFQQQQNPGTYQQWNFPPPPLMSGPAAKLLQRNIHTAKKSPAILLAKCDSSQNTYQARLAVANVSCVEWTDVDYLQETHGISKYVAENLTMLFKNKHTIPFISHYKKNMTMSMNLDELKNVRDSIESTSEIKQKANDLIEEIDKRGKWTPDLHAFIHATKSIRELQWIKSMFNRSKWSFAKKTKGTSFNKLAQDIMNIEPGSLDFLVHPENELESGHEMKNGIICALADIICTEKCTLEIIQVLRRKHFLTIEVTKAKDTEKADKKLKTFMQKHDETKYNFYYNFSSLIDDLKPRQILEIYCGEAKKILNVNITVPEEFGKDFEQYCALHYEKVCNASMLHKMLLSSAFNRTWSKVIHPSICTRARNEIMAKGEIAVIDDIAKHIKQLLLTPPIKGKVVIVIEPGLIEGCKLAVVTDKGDVLETETIHPHNVDNPKAKQEAQRTLAGIILVHKCTILALGNGEGHRETKDFLNELIEKRAFEPMDVIFMTVDKIASPTRRCRKKTSSDGQDRDTDTGVAICIAKRLLEPMDELVKIDPKKLIPRAYYFKLPEKRLALKLNEAIEEAVCSVGVDVNTASVSLLERVAGLDETKAKNIVEWRKRSGPFVTRNDLKKVPGICSKVFEQCAGFIRIIPETAIALNDGISKDSFDYLDQTSIHPEFYEIAEAFLKAANCDSKQLGTKAFAFAVTLFANLGYDELAKKFDTTVETIKMIVESLSVEKGRDVGGTSDTTDNRTTSTTFQNVQAGAILTGVVRGIAPFGAFLDVGFEVQGLLHNNNMKGITLSRGQRVEVRVDKVNRERRRLGLALIKCL